MRRILFAAGLLLLALPLGTAHAAGQLSFTGQFRNAGGEFDFAQFTAGKEKIAVVYVTAGDQRSSVEFQAPEWQSFVKLWRKARGVKSASLQPVGSFQESGTSRPAQLNVAAGPGVQFTVIAAHGPLVFVLQPSDYARFDASVNRMTQWAGP
jgi:hypothetical protein